MSTGSGLALLSRDYFALGQIVLITIIYVFIRVKTLSNTNYVASRYIKREKGSLPFDVRRSKTSMLKLPTSFCA